MLASFCLMVESKSHVVKRKEKTPSCLQLVCKFRIGVLPRPLRAFQFGLSVGMVRKYRVSVYMFDVEQNVKLAVEMESSHRRKVFT